MLRANRPSPASARATPNPRVSRLSTSSDVVRRRWRMESPLGGGPSCGLGSVGDVAVAQVHVQLALDPLQSVVDRLHMPVERLGDLLVALALDVQAEHLGLEVA